MNTAELVSHYTEVRRRLYMGRPNTVRALPAPAPEPAKEVVPDFPPIPFNFLKAPGALAIVKFVALKRGISVRDIRGTSRSKHLVAARHEAIWLIKQHRPWMSLPEIGTLFSIDHTSVLHALRKNIYGARYSRQAARTRVAQVNPEFRAGERLSDDIPINTLNAHSCGRFEEPMLARHSACEQVEDRFNNYQAVA